MNADQNLPASHERVNAPSPAQLPSRRIAAPIAITTGVACLVAWSWLVLATDAPGVVHLLLSGGLFLVIWGIVSRTA